MTAIDGEVRVSPLARFVIDDEPVVGAKGQPFDRGGVLTFVDARVTGVGKRTFSLFMLSALVALFVSVVALRSVLDAPSADGSQRSLVVPADHRAADVPALVIAAPGRRDGSLMSGEPRLAGRR